MPSSNKPFTAWPKSGPRVGAGSSSGVNIAVTVNPKAEASLQVERLDPENAVECQNTDCGRVFGSLEVEGFTCPACDVGQLMKFNPHSEEQ